MQENARQAIGGSQNIEEAEEVLRQVGQPEQAGKVVQALGEDQVGGGQQGGENRQDRQGDQYPAEDGPKAVPPGMGSDHGGFILSVR